MRTRTALLIIIALLHISVAIGSTDALVLSSSTLILEADSDGPPHVATFRLTTRDDSSRWTVRSDVPWLAPALTHGRGSQTIDLRISPEKLEPGLHRAVLSFSATESPELQQSVQVEYTVHPRRGVSVHEGNDQVGVINNAFAAPLIVRVTDAAGNPLPGTRIEFATVVGSTEPARAVVETDRNGLARFQPTIRGYGAIGVTASAAIEHDSPAYFKAVASGWTSTFAGDGVQASGGDGGPAEEAQLNAPSAMVLLNNEMLLVEYFNHVLRSIDLTSGTIKRLAGTGKQGFNGDGLSPLETNLNDPFGIALGSDKQVVFSDYYNNRIRVIDGKSGKVSTIAGAGVSGYSGDGGLAVKAQIDVPLAIASDSSGNIYMSDWHHNVVRKLDAKTGIIDTVAGVGVPGFSGDGGLAICAQLDRPYNFYADSNGDLLISDAGNHRIRHVDQASGIITTIAGQGEFGYSGKHDQAVNEPLKGAFSVTMDKELNLYVSEFFGHRIRKIGSTREPQPRAASRTERLLRQSRQIFGALPEVATSTENPLSPAKITLEKNLFHEPRLSQDGSVSCSSCHPLDRFGMDGLKLAVGIRVQEGDRNSPSVFNAALQDSQFWNGRAKKRGVPSKGTSLTPQGDGDAE